MSTLVIGAGYVGSRLAEALAAQTIDSSRNFRYQDVDAGFLNRFDRIIFTAGHSSVKACDADPVESLRNNVMDFAVFLRKLSGQLLLYTSSITVYVKGRQCSVSDPLPEPVSHYDMHKQAAESLIRLGYPNHCIMRLGTVCGRSPKMRWDTVVNSMCMSAKQNGSILLSNPEVMRPLLGLDDLVQFVRVEKRGTFNVASVNVRMLDIAAAVSVATRVPVETVLLSTKYDVSVELTQMEAPQTLAEMVASAMEAV